MARIAHLSDIHFGANDPTIVAATIDWLKEKQPDLVIISGDLTQRAREGQFHDAAEYLRALRENGHKLLVVPGNHDIPLYDVFRRFASPLRRYKRHIAQDLCPWVETDEAAILGINTARSLTIKDGRINHDQMQLIRRRFKGVAPHKTRILVTHHPLFELPIGQGNELSEAVGRQEDALQAIADAGIHLTLAGHFHRTYAEAASKMVAEAGPTLVIQAGTATSTRLRNQEPQSFNWLHVEPDNRMELQVIVWNGEGFQRASHVGFSLDGNQWHSEELSTHEPATGDFRGAKTPSAAVGR
ncbi:metallophosphoesterase [Sphingorhabdus sp. YGSMI21]|uniref:metallophosphoesterase family protein n=1 Tax=Sphingorhabdus sp. YGSMI21 TaxID=2077182 RepID=UPI000C1E8C4B|nr:metallophosphoesterase [Sphingorhabdus sp. YGSMI21]ATW05210.1 phosphohydrolase [Sphingorhabdus sp. YGSMI21]